MSYFTSILFVVSLIESNRCKRASFGESNYARIPFSTIVKASENKVLFGLPEILLYFVAVNIVLILFKARCIWRLNTIIHVYTRYECMSLRLRTPCEESHKSWLIFVLPGWTLFPNDAYVTDMANAFLCRGDYNFFECLSSLAEAWAKTFMKIPAENIHLIGHSLGAHMWGYAGVYFQNILGKKLHVITGLDPANPVFNEGGRFILATTW
ncbi:Phospholipase A1 [Lucilia cuprina]|nr:Phospholipase A1 [Lucilia cuprina]